MATTPGPAGLREPEAGTHRPFEDAIAAADTLTPARPDQQQDMTGGWRRRPLLGAMAGLVTSTSLIAGVGGGGMSSHVIVLAGVAGLAAGALSVATGQYVAVSSYNELVRERARKQALELLFHPDAEEKSWPRCSAPAVSPPDSLTPWPGRSPPTPCRHWPSTSGNSSGWTSTSFPPRCQRPRHQWPPSRPGR